MDLTEAYSLPCPSIEIAQIAFLRTLRLFFSKLYQLSITRFLFIFKPNFDLSLLQLKLGWKDI